MKTGIRYGLEIEKMTLDEAIEQFKYDAECNRADLDLSFAEDNDKVAEWLEELKAYRAIGTPEECRAAVEKQKEIKPKELKNIYPSGQYECPVCGYCVGKHKYFKSTPLGETLANCKMEFNYCPDCGQKLDWSDEE